ncbi:hypothetical protein [Aeromicrobium sp. 179-A 4D2 NHS]|uniref:hypothetical protein n=1 Tax=Aeromicrobium sp. 179-A 4D2 NHS TaxID=3142375 RepID=UPI0039A01E2C
MPTKTVNEWTDGLGQTIRPGDHIAVSTVNNKSPQTVIAKVTAINVTDAKGNPVFDNGFGDTYTPHYGGPTETDTIPGATITAIPVADMRGFIRWGTYSGGKAKAVTYRLLGNIIKMSDDQVAALYGHVMRKHRNTRSDDGTVFGPAIVVNGKAYQTLPAIEDLCNASGLHLDVIPGADHPGLLDVNPDLDWHYRLVEEQDDDRYLLVARKELWLHNPLLRVKNNGKTSLDRELINEMKASQSA